MNLEAEKVITVDEATREDGARVTGAVRDKQTKETRTLASRARRKAEDEYRTHRDRPRALRAEHARRAAIDEDWAAQLPGVPRPTVSELDDELRELYTALATLTDDDVDKLFREIAEQDRRVAVVEYRLDHNRDLGAAKKTEARRRASIEQIPDPVQRRIFMQHATISDEALEELWRDIAWRQEVLQARYLEVEPSWREAEQRRRHRIENDQTLDPRLKALYLDQTILDQADMMGAFDIAQPTVWKWRAPVKENRRVQPHPRVSPVADVTLGTVADKLIPGVQFGKIVEWLVMTHRFLWDAPTGQVIRNPNPPRHGRSRTQP